MVNRLPKIKSTKEVVVVTKSTPFPKVQYPTALIGRAEH